MKTRRIRMKQRRTRRGGSAPDPKEEAKLLEAEAKRLESIASELKLKYEGADKLAKEARAKVPSKGIFNWFSAKAPAKPPVNSAKPPVNSAKPPVISQPTISPFPVKQ